MKSVVLIEPYLAELVLVAETGSQTATDYEAVRALIRARSVVESVDIRARCVVESVDTKARSVVEIVDIRGQVCGRISKYKGQVCGRNSRYKGAGLW